MYSGTLVIRGNEGLFRVATPLGQVLDQDVSARGDGNVVWLVGRNPRLAASTTPALGYSADSFRLVRNAVGDWVFADVCDANVCAPVYVTDIPSNEAPPQTDEMYQREGRGVREQAKG